MSDPQQSALLIDDDELLRDMYARKFRDRGIAVEAVGSAKEALEKLRAGFLPDIITFDIVMPGMDGFSFLETLKKEALAPKAAKIALTNQGADEEKDRAIALGADAYIIKAATTPTGAVEAVLGAVRDKKGEPH